MDPKYHLEMIPDIARASSLPSDSTIPTPAKAVHELIYYMKKGFTIQEARDARGDELGFYCPNGIQDALRFNSGDCAEVWGEE